jgi:hypothetical protein
LLRRDQEQLGNPDPTEAEREYMWDGAGIVAALLVAEVEQRIRQGEGAA